MYLSIICYKDLLIVNAQDLTPSLITYIGFSLASFAFLTQYLTFPKSLFTDLSNLIKKGYPRIIDSKIKKKDIINENYRIIISFFFQLDYITYALLMYILYSIIIVLLFVCAKIGSIFDVNNFELCLNNFYLIISLITLCYFIIRIIIGYRGTFRKDNKHNYIRGNGFWPKKHRVLIFLSDLLILFLIFFGYIISFILQSGFFLFLWLIFIYICMFILYLLVTYYYSPVTKLLNIWLYLANQR